MFMTASIFISILRQYKRSSKGIPQFTGKLYEFSQKIQVQKILINKVARLKPDAILKREP